MSTEKIKSITVIKEIYGATLNSVFYADRYNISEEELKLAINNPAFFQIEYEKPTILKRPDGSLISEPFGYKIIHIELNLDGTVGYQTKLYWSKPEQEEYSRWLTAHLAKGLIFLPEDKDLAEKKAQMLSKQLEIQYEIDRLNAEEGWVADWTNPDQQKYYIRHEIHQRSQGDNIGYGVDYYINSGVKYMSSNTHMAIQAKYTQDELKQYLGIII